MKLVLAIAATCIVFAPAVRAVAQPFLIPLSKQHPREPQPPQPSPVPIAPPQSAANSDADTPAADQPSSPDSRADAPPDPASK